MSFTIEAMFENEEMVSFLSDDPTAIAVEMQPGVLIASVNSSEHPGTSVTA
jgi:hypothetical protein